MSIDVQKVMFSEIKKEIENIDRILNTDNDKVRDDLICGLYRLLCEQNIASSPMLIRF